MLFNANPTAATTHDTACSYSTPFKIGVHFDDEANIIFAYEMLRKNNIARFSVSAGLPLDDQLQSMQQEKRLELS